MYTFTFEGRFIDKTDVLFDYFSAMAEEAGLPAGHYEVSENKFEPAVPMSGPVWED